MAADMGDVDEQYHNGGHVLAFLCSRRLIRGLASGAVK